MTPEIFRHLELTVDRGRHLRFEERSRQPGLSDDTGEGPRLEFAMIGNWNGDRGLVEPLLHHHVASALPNLRESMCFEYPADVTAR